MMKNDGFDLQEYGYEFSRNLLEGVFSLISEEGKIHGADFTEEVMLTVLASYVCTIVYNKLKLGSNPIMKTYREAIENAISAGFEGAYNQMPNKLNTEFMTKISTVPDPVSKLAC